MSALGFRRIAWGALVYNIAVVAWGAFVRATGSGGGCGGSWPVCNGEVIPTSPTLHTIIEFTHRSTSGIDGALAVLLLVLAFRVFPRGHLARTGAVLFLTAMVLEALFGALLVKLGLVEANASPLRAVGVSVHQVVTFYLFGALALTLLWSNGLGPLRLRGQGGTGIALVASLLALPLLAVTGAIAALGDTLFPAQSLAAGMRADLSPAASFLLHLRVFHPVLAVAACALVLFAAGLAARRGPRSRDAAYAVAIMFLVQLGAGVLNLALLAPIWMQLVHLALADITWLAVVHLAAVTLAEPAPEPLAAPA